jgi:hypothetical protein
MSVPSALRYIHKYRYNTILFYNDIPSITKLFKHSTPNIPCNAIETYEQQAYRRKYEDVSTSLSTTHTELKTKIHNHLGLPIKTVAT